MSAIEVDSHPSDYDPTRGTGSPGSPCKVGNIGYEGRVHIYDVSTAGEIGGKNSEARSKNSIGSELAILGAIAA